MKMSCLQNHPMKTLIITIAILFGISSQTIAASDSLKAKNGAEIWCSEDGDYRLVLVEQYNSVYLYHVDTMIDFYSSEGMMLVDEYLEEGEEAEIPLTELMFTYGITRKLELVNAHDYVKFDIEIISQNEERVHLCSRDRAGHMMEVTWYENQVWYEGQKVYKHKYRTHSYFEKERNLKDLKTMNAWLDSDNGRLILFDWGGDIGTVEL